MISGLFIGFFAVLLTYVVWYYYQIIHAITKKRLPKGPFPLPFFGNLLSLFTSKPDEQFQKWAQLYGTKTGVFTYYLGDKPVAVITDSKLKKDLWALDSFAGREQRYVYGKTIAESILVAEGARWKNERAFQEATIREITTDSKYNECLASMAYKEAAIRFVERLQANPGTSLRIELQTCVLDAHCQLLFGRQFESSEWTGGLDGVLKVTTAFFASIDQGCPTRLCDILPGVLQGLVAKMTKFRSFMDDWQHFLQDIEKQLAKVDLAGDDTLAALWLADLQKEKKGFQTKEQLHCAVAIVLLTANEVATAIRWIISHLAEDLTLQNKVLDAIDFLPEFPNWADRNLTPDLLPQFLAALGILTPVSIGRRTCNAVEIANKNLIIPTGCPVVALRKASELDPMTANQAIMPELMQHLFGSGKRMCIGRNLACSVDVLIHTLYACLKYGYSCNPVLVIVIPRKNGIICTPDMFDWS